MAFISLAEHTEFQKILNQSIGGLEEQNLEDPSLEIIAINLKKERDLLQELYSECNNRTQELRRLIAHYQQLQRKARSELRVFRQRCRQK